MPTKFRPFPIECTIESKSSFFVGEKVELQFTLLNQSNQPLYVLKWYTPLEGLKGEIFQVLHNNVEIPYMGILVKRGEPTNEDYLTVEPGKTVSAVVDLATGYNLSDTGTYHIAFTSKLYDITEDAASIPRKMENHQSQPLSCNQVNFEITNR